MPEKKRKGKNKKGNEFQGSKLQLPFHVDHASVLEKPAVPSLLQNHVRAWFPETGNGDILQLLLLILFTVEFSEKSQN